MKRKQIEARIRYLEKLSAKTRDTSTLAMIARCLDRLITMKASDENE